MTGMPSQSCYEEDDEEDEPVWSELLDPPVEELRQSLGKQKLDWQLM